MSHQLFYKHNVSYTTFLETQEKANYTKYALLLDKFSDPSAHILDVGCGTGLALSCLSEIAHQKKLCGIDISESSIEIARMRGFDVCLYDGLKLPFDNEFFDTVGSFNVIEHTDDPITFLDEQLRVLKKNGVIVVACPNFLAVTNNYHAHTRGVFRKLLNIAGIGRRIIMREFEFEKMDTIEREPIQPDDDACNITNPLDIQSWAKSRKLTRLMWSCQSVQQFGVVSKLDWGYLRLLFGSCLFGFKKQ